MKNAMFLTLHTDVFCFSVLLEKDWGNAFDPSVQEETERSVQKGVRSHDHEEAGLILCKDPNTKKLLFACLQ